MFPFLNTSVKYLSADFPTPMIVWGRYLGHFLFMALAFLPGNGWRLFVTHHFGIQLLRSLLLLGSTALYFTALGTIDLAMAAAIGFAAPFIVTSLSVPILGERVGWRRWSAVTIGFFGVLLVARPGTGAVPSAALLTLGSTLCYGTYQVLTRKLAARDSPVTTILYTAIVGATITSLVVPFYWHPPREPIHIALFLGMGLVGGFGHFFVIKAYQFGEASLIAPFAYLQLLGSTVLGYWVFGDLPDRWTWIGAAVIIGCGIYIAYRETALASAPAQR